MKKLILILALAAVCGTSQISADITSNSELEQMLIENFGDMVDFVEKYRMGSSEDRKQNCLDENLQLSTNFLNAAYGKLRSSINFSKKNPQSCGLMQCKILFMGAITSIVSTMTLEGIFRPDVSTIYDEATQKNVSVSKSYRSGDEALEQASNYFDQRMRG